MGMDRFDEAFEQVPRANFLPDEVKHQADWDMALPIGYGQTNSQPSTVRWMLEWLDPQPGDKILDVGSGSGWTSALLANLVVPQGKVFAVEKVPELVEFGRENCERLGVRNVSFYDAGEVFGMPAFAPYDRILVSAAAAKLPEELLRQLKIPGRLVIPVGHDIHVIDKTGENDFENDVKRGFVFVPLVAQR